MPEHKTRTGETWAAIAAQYGTTEDQLKHWNQQIKSLGPGVTLRINSTQNTVGQNVPVNREFSGSTTFGIQSPYSGRGGGAYTPQQLAEFEAQNPLNKIANWFKYMIKPVPAGTVGLSRTGMPYEDALYFSGMQQFNQKDRQAYVPKSPPVDQEKMNTQMSNFKQKDMQQQPVQQPNYSLLEEMNKGMLNFKQQDSIENLDKFLEEILFGGGGGPVAPAKGEAGYDRGAYLRTVLTTKQLSRRAQRKRAANTVVTSEPGFNSLTTGSFDWRI